MMVRWFHILYFDDVGVQETLDAIVLLANPREKRRAHITLRGPYKSQDEAENVRVDIRGADISICGVGNFFEYGQNTIFLNSDSEHIRANWWKPKYGYNPHITLYDGDSREFAEDLYSRIKISRPFMKFSAGYSEIIRSVSGQKDFSLWFDVNLNTVRSVSNDDFNIESIANMPAWQRLMLIDRLCVKLKWLGVGGSERAAAIAV